MCNTTFVTITSELFIKEIQVCFQLVGKIALFNPICLSRKKKSNQSSTSTKHIESNNKLFKVNAATDSEKTRMTSLPNSLQASQVHSAFVLWKMWIHILFCWYFLKHIMNRGRKCSQNQVVDTFASGSINDKRKKKKHKQKPIKPRSGWLGSW